MPECRGVGGRAALLTVPPGRGQTLEGQGLWPSLNPGLGGGGVSG
jgi:hypothetical protein